MFNHMHVVFRIYFFKRLKIQSVKLPSSVSLQAPEGCSYKGGMQESVTAGKPFPVDGGWSPLSTRPP